ncbi:MAG TPA: tail fiber assembly protein [Acidimicrobiia bacterium]
MDVAAVISHLYPNARASIMDNDYSTLLWDESNTAPKPTLADLEAAWPAVRDARAWDRIRAERDRLLTGCDWTQIADAPVDATAKQAWADYRQALRDVPQDFATPEEVVWPEAP